jgi:cyanophycinase
VLGESSVVIYDARRAHVTDGGQPLLGATGLRVHVLPAGGVFDPKTGSGGL